MAKFSRKIDVTIGFSAESVLSNLKKKDLVKDSNIQNVYNVRKCVVNTITKTSERCQSAVARNRLFSILR